MARVHRVRPKDETTEGLSRAYWSWFDDPFYPGSGKKHMDRDLVSIHDRICGRYKKQFGGTTMPVKLAYASPKLADRLSLTTFSPHRIGKAMSVYIPNDENRHKFIQGLMIYQVPHIMVVSHIDPMKRFVYYDIDHAQGPPYFKTFGW